jgi:hypothetical protein
MVAHLLIPATVWLPRRGGHNLADPGKHVTVRYPSTSPPPPWWLLLFCATSVIWGSSFLFIRVAVEHMPPAAVVFGRAVLGAAFLVPLAARRRAVRDGGAAEARR